MKKNSNCTLCGETVEKARGLFFDEENCNEYDIFQLYKLPHQFWVSEKMAEIIRKFEFSNIILIPAHDFKIGN